MIAAAGLDHVAVGTPTADEREAFSARISHLPPRDRAPYFLGGVFLGLLPRAAHPALKAFADTWRPDLVVREASEFAGAIVAEQSEIAHVRVSVSNGHSLTRTVAPFDKLRRAFGLEPTRADVCGARARSAHFPYPWNRRAVMVRIFHNSALRRPVRRSPPACRTGRLHLRNLAST